MATDGKKQKDLQAYQHEKAFQNKVLAYLKKLDGCFHFKVVMANCNGIPDVIGCYKGKFFAFELKSKTGQPSKLQKVMMRKINNAGGVAISPRTIAEVKECLAKM